MKGRSFGASMDTCRLLGDADLAYAVKKKGPEMLSLSLKELIPVQIETKALNSIKRLRNTVFYQEKFFLWVGRYYQGKNNVPVEKTS
jgi:hypothetical protein